MPDLVVVAGIGNLRLFAAGPLLPLDFVIVADRTNFGDSVHVDLVVVTEDVDFCHAPGIDCVASSSVNGQTGGNRSKNPKFLSVPTSAFAYSSWSMGYRLFLTTAIDYVNARPHIGHALEKIQADVIARYRRVQGDDVLFLTGTDDNALKNVLAAKDAGLTTEAFVRKNAENFKELRGLLDLSWDDFIRTTEERHRKAVARFWKACRKDDIYRKAYNGLYCLGCEEFKTEKELLNGFCAEHPGTKLEEIEESNYFFRLSAYQKRIEDALESSAISIVPEGRRREMLSFVHQGLEDFSISRSKERAQGWGIPVPDDDTQVIYVWFDALINYITAAGYANDEKRFDEYWSKGRTLHVIGKGINRFHSIYWPAMLMSAGVALPKQIFVHGYITVGGQKMSKTWGNVIDPAETVRKYGTDPVRYYLLREIPSQEDGDFSFARLHERYNGDLANGIGNLVSRTSTLGERLKSSDFDITKDVPRQTRDFCDTVLSDYTAHFDSFRLNEALADVWRLVAYADKLMNDRKPWAEKDPVAFAAIIKEVAYIVSTIANSLVPFMPQTAARIHESIRIEDSVLKIRKSSPLFPRLS